MTLRTNEAADNAQIMPAGIILPVFDQRIYITPANVNEAPIDWIQIIGYSLIKPFSNVIKSFSTYPIGKVASVVFESLNAHHNLNYLAKWEIINNLKNKSLLKLF